MNRDQVKGAARNLAGKVQQKVGELTGNKTQQVKGAAKQVEGRQGAEGRGQCRAGTRQGSQENPLRGRAHVEGNRPRRRRTVDSREGNNNGLDQHIPGIW